MGAIGYSDMTITNSDISGNTSSAGFIFSGAVTAGDDCTVTVSDTTIRNNVGIMGAAAISYDVSGSLRLERTTITGNSNGGVAADQYGSGLVGSIVEVIDSTVSGNGFISGNPNPDAVGGFYSRTLDPTYSAGSSLTIRNSTVNGNYSGGNGGGVFARYTEAVNIENSTINGNQAPLYAGGGVAGLSSNITITRSTISNNTSIGTGGNGAGGIFMLANSPSATSLTVKQSTISGNSTSGDGGAIIMYAGAGYTVSGAISGSTITNNRADSDGDAVGSYGGVYVGYAIDVTLGVASLTITGSILAGNTDPNGQSPDLFDLGFEEGGTPNVTSVEFSLIGSNVGNALAVANPGPDANGNKVGTTGNLLNPNLGALGNNGGPTSTHKPNAGSPAINAGNTVQTEATDQRGLGRVGGGRADMGSVESEFTATPDGDFDNNGIYNCADIDALANAIATGGSVATFDLNGDNALTIADQDVWRAEAGGINIGAGRVYKVGDANLDGGVDGSDFGLWNSNKFTNNKDWCKGNFNADGVTDGSDFGLWNANKFTASDEGRSETGLASDDVVVSSNQGAARSRTSRIMDSAKPMNRESNKAQAVSNAREEFGTAARRAPVAAPKAAAVESFTAKTVSVKSEEAKVVALPTLSTSSTASSFDATRNSTSRQVKKVAAHDSIFSMWGAE